MHRRPSTPRENKDDGRSLESLRMQFEACADELAMELCVIVEWLADGGILLKPALAFAAAPDHMNELRYLLGQIETVTTRAEKGLV